MINFTFYFNGIELDVEAEVTKGYWPVVNIYNECTDPGDGDSADIQSVFISGTKTIFETENISISGVDLDLIIEQEAVAKFRDQCL